MVLTEQKRRYMEKLSDENGIISALAFDQRGALKRLMAQYQTDEPTVAQMEELKVLVSEELTPFASSMLLDPEYGLPATKVLHKDAGLLLAYEKTGYDTTSTKRLPDCLVDWSVKRLKEEGQMPLNSCSTMMSIVMKRQIVRNKLILNVSVQNAQLKIFRFISKS